MAAYLTQNWVKTTQHFMSAYSVFKKYYFKRFGVW